MTKRWAPSFPTCWCTRSATTSVSPTRTWRRSRRRRVDAVGAPLTPCPARQERSSAIGCLAFGRAAPGRAFVLGPVSQRLTLANTPEGVHSRRHAAFVARREHAGARGRAAGIANAPGFSSRRVRQHGEQSDQQACPEHFSHFFHSRSPAIRSHT